MLKLKNGYRWRYDKNKHNFCFQKVAHLEFTLYSDFWLSHHHRDCTTIKKNSCQKCDYEINSSAHSVRFKIKLIKGITIHFQSTIYLYMIRTLKKMTMILILILLRLKSR